MDHKLKCNSIKQTFCLTTSTLNLITALSISKENTSLKKNEEVRCENRSERAGKRASRQRQQQKSTFSRCPQKKKKSRKILNKKKKPQLKEFNTSMVFRTAKHGEIIIIKGKSGGVVPLSIYILPSGCNN